MKRLAFAWLVGCAPTPDLAALEPCDGGACAAGSTCLPDPRDESADLCFDCDDPSLRRDYVSRDPEECAVIDFDCGFTRVGFGDVCGCGCEP